MVYINVLNFRSGIRRKPGIILMSRSYFKSVSLAVHVYTYLGT